MDLLIRRKKCRKCENGTLKTRVRKHLIFKIVFFWLPLKRYKCDMCEEASYILGDVKQYLYVVDVHRKEQIVVVAAVTAARDLNTIRNFYSKQYKSDTYSQSQKRESLPEDIETISVGNLHNLPSYDRNAESFLQKILKETGGNITLQMN